MISWRAWPRTSDREANVFDLSIGKILVLLLLGLVIFGPEQLPKMAAQAGRALRDLRRLTDSARSDLADSLGPEFRDFDINDLNPRHFVRKHLLDDDIAAEFSDGWVDDAVTGGAAAVASGTSEEATASERVLMAGEIPPYDAEAT